MFALVFAAVIYPLVGHWIWGGGFLADLGMQDFAGSTVVHLCGATAALAGTLLLGRAHRQVRRARARPHPIPGHSMPLAVLGVLILWFGWFGFNPGSTLAAVGARFADIAVTTNLAAAAGVLGAMIAGFIAQRTIDVGFAGNGAIAGLVAITAPVRVRGQLGGGRHRPRRRRPRWSTTVVAVDRIRVDDPIGAIAGHGMGGIWGTLSCGLFTTPALAETNGVGQAGLFYGGGAAPARRPGARHRRRRSRSCSSPASAVFFACKKTIGLRVTAQQELEGLDIHEHGMWGYPEQFLPGYGATQPYVAAPRGAGRRSAPRPEPRPRPGRGD